MSLFISMGRNCEFGVAQRRCKAEPFDLLRWGHTDIEVLLHMLEDRFQHIADPAALEISVSDGGEYILDNTFYRFTWHTFATESKMTAERVLAREKARLPRQAEMLLGELEEGRRTLVRAAGGDPEDHALQDLVRLCAALGPSQILFVSENAGRAGDVERAGPTLLRGYHPGFADPANVDAETDTAVWLSLCRRARDVLVAA